MTYPSPQVLPLRRAFTILVTISMAVSLAAAAVTAPAADAAEEPVADAVLSWRVLNNAWTATNLSQRAGAHAPAIRHSSEWVFPGGAGTHNPETGEVDVGFDGALIMGNQSQGGYRVVLAEPEVSISDEGDGSITADVYACTGPAGSHPCPTGEHAFGSGDTAVTVHLLGADVEVATFSGATSEEAGTAFTYMATPDFPAGWDEANPERRSWPASFIDLLDTTPSLQGHFRETGSGLDPGKAPLPFTVTVGPHVLVTPDTGLVHNQVVEVHATGFAPLAPRTVAQCTPDPESAEDCTDAEFILTDAQGQITVNWAVQALVGDYNCVADGGCAIWVLQIPPIPGNEFAFAEISFTQEGVCVQPPFPDVSITHPFCFEIAWMKDAGITTGFPDGTFRGSLQITRQAVAAFLARLAEAELEECTEAPFTDVATTHPFCAEIAWMKDAGITTGFPDGTFRGSLQITRQAVAAFLARFAEAQLEECTEPPFSDVSTSHPFCPEIAWMADAGITTGFPDGTFRGSLQITRQAVAAFLFRLAHLA